MNFNLIIMLMTIGFVLVLFVFRLIMPQLMRREIFFGVQMPASLMTSPELNEFKRAYIKNYLFICGIFTLSFCLALWFMPSNAVLFIGLAIYFALSTWVYYLTHTRVKHFKNAHEDNSYAKQVVIVDTCFRNNANNSILPSSWWFLIPLVIILFNIIAGYLRLEDLPIFIPSHWNSLGMVDGRVFKSYGFIFALPTVQIFITVLMFLFYKVITWSKQQINVSNPLESIERSRIFRYRWGGNAIFVNTILLLGITLLNLFLLQIIPMNTDLLLIVQPTLILFILLDLLVMSLWTGQGGSRINLDPNRLVDDNLNNLNDDKYWIWGLFYFNRHDPALFVEKRYGITWGLNYGTAGAYVLIGCLIGSVILLNHTLYFLLI